MEIEIVETNTRDMTFITPLAYKYVKNLVQFKKLIDSCMHKQKLQNPSGHRHLYQ